MFGNMLDNSNLVSNSDGQHMLSKEKKNFLPQPKFTDHGSQHNRYQNYKKIVVPVPDEAESEENRSFQSSDQDSENVSQLSYLSRTSRSNINRIPISLRVPSENVLLEEQIAENSDSLNNELGVLINQFKTICFHSTSPISEAQEFQLDGVLRGLARLQRIHRVDECLSVHSNCAVAEAIIKNDCRLLQSLLRFTPKIPRFVLAPDISGTTATQIPLVLAAANHLPVDNGNNVLTVILNRWQQDNLYGNIVLERLTSTNNDDKSIFDYLIELIRLNENLDVHFRNFELLLINLKRLKKEKILTKTNNRKMFKFIETLDDEDFVFTSDRQQCLQRLLNAHRQIKSYQLIKRIFRK